ncbi:MAG: hypothetical protein LBD75_02365 [Candidatus Peribacteria bacterium]|jgi:hypothetical protein|nr:hypothetical protein [Candidatus Peribacteria bacterium]
MLQLLSGARAGMSVLDIYKNKRLVDVVAKETSEKKDTSEQKTERRLSPSEEMILRLL